MPPLLPLVRPRWRLKPGVDDEPDHRPPIFINRPTTTEPTTEVPTVPTTTEPTMEVPTVADASADVRSARKRGRSPTLYEEMSPRSRKIYYAPDRIRLNDERYKGKTHLMPLWNDYGGGYWE